MNFFLTFCKTRKKFDKYVKVNKIRNKTIIDIRGIVEEEGLDLSNEDSLYYFKVLIYKKIQISMEKGKDIYYIPNFWSPTFRVEALLRMKGLLGGRGRFNLLMFHDEFAENGDWLDCLLGSMSEFDASLLIKDY